MSIGSTLDKGEDTDSLMLSVGDLLLSEGTWAKVVISFRTLNSHNT